MKFLDHTQLQAHPIGLLCTSDQPVAEVATYAKRNKHNETNIRALSGIQTRGPSNREAACLHLIRNGYRNRR